MVNVHEAGRKAGREGGSVDESDAERGKGRSGGPRRER